MIEEGDKCPEVGCEGEMTLPPVVGCSCHIDPPCTACMNNVIECSECGYTDEL